MVLYKTDFMKKLIANFFYRVQFRNFVFAKSFRAADKIPSIFLLLLSIWDFSMSSKLSFKNTCFAKFYFYERWYLGIYTTITKKMFTFMIENLLL